MTWAVIRIDSDGAEQFLELSPTQDRAEARSLDLARHEHLRWWKKRDELPDEVCMTPKRRFRVDKVIV